MEYSPIRDVGARFYISGTTGTVQATVNPMVSSTLDTDRGKSLNAELDQLCGPPFICDFDSSTGEAAVVYGNFECASTGDVSYRAREEYDVDLNRGFQSLTLLGSTPTLDGLGVKLRLKSSRQDLTANAEESYYLGSPAVAVTRTRRSKLVRKRKALRAKKKDAELFAERLRFHQARFYSLCDRECDNPFIRCAHWYNDGRTFAFASVFLETRSSRKAIVSVLWHTTIRPHRAVCVSLSIESENDLLVAHCSCSPLLGQVRNGSTGCYHARVCLADEAFHGMVCSEIRRRERIQDLEDRGDTIFGQCIPLEDENISTINLSIVLDRNASKNSTLASPWLFFMMFDINALLFVPVSKVKGKPFRCFLCRIPLSRRGVCGHEDTAKKVSKFFREGRGGRGGLLLELALPNGVDDDAGADTGSSIPQEGAEVLARVTPNQSLSIPEVYTPVDVRRPILPCRGEWEDMVNLAKALNAVRNDESLVFDDRFVGRCHECGSPNNEENQEGYARTVYLFTLNHGTRKVKVYDWGCPVCERTRRFSGRGSGVFPVSHNSAFTTELMYLWLEMTCFQGYSFRNAYRTTRAFQRAASKVLQSKGRRQDFDEEAHKAHAASRRRANDAPRAFMKLLDTNSSTMTRTLFSCNTCEVPLTKDDCKELGITEEEGRLLKRFKALVIDGTASGILTELPPMERDHVKVPEPTRLKKKLNEKKKLLKSNPHRLALKHILDLSRECFRKWKKASESLLSTSSTSRLDQLRFWINKSGTKSYDGIIEPQTYPSEVEQNIAKLFLQEIPCFCSQGPSLRRQNGSSTSHDRECIEIRKIMKKRKEDKSIFLLLRSLFSIQEGSPERVIGNCPQPQENAQVSAEEENAAENTQENEENENHDSAEDRSREALAAESSDNETVTENGVTGNGVTDDGSDSDSEIRELYNEIRSCRKVSGIWLNLIPFFQPRYSQMFECTLILIEFLLLEHVAMPYVGRFECQQTEEPTGHQTTLSMTSFTEKSMQAHRRMIDALEKVTEPCTNECVGTSSSRQFRTSCLCFSRLKNAALSVRVANPILSAFCQELLKLRKPLHGEFQTLIKSLVTVLRLHLNTAKMYFTTFEKCCSNECKDYWLSWGRPATTTQEIQGRISGNEGVNNRSNSPDGVNGEVERNMKLFAKKELEAVVQQRGNSGDQKEGKREELQR